MQSSGAVIPYVSHNDVTKAIAEFDRLGRDDFLRTYRFKEARAYYLFKDGKFYDSKALYGVACKYAHGQPLQSKDFSGGDATVGRRFRALGFTVLNLDRLSGDEEPEVPDLDAEEAGEGRAVLRRHLARERDPRIRAKKIRSVIERGGRVACEVCGFDFRRVYGERGHGYIECHHRVPLHVSGETLTRLEDLALLCSNCHRMIHRSPWLTVEELQKIVVSRQEEHL